ncbi:MAG: alpha/beta hydrolase [Bacteroidales bacterium]|nr:alpha/beta hydrolase [Bacteroidales bacterium]
MSSETVLVDGPEGALEACHHGAAAGPAAPWVAVVCHPHPLHGGTMDNKVVTTLARAYAALDIPAVRFNFRGVGASEGVHADGVGEVDDLEAVADWARQRYPGARLLLAGFSFGSGVAGNGALRLGGVDHLVLVAPPVGRYGFTRHSSFPCPWALVMGGRDELVDPAGVHDWAGRQSPPPRVLDLPESGHFFHGHLVQLREGLVEILRDQLRL